MGGAGHRRAVGGGTRFLGPHRATVGGVIRRCFTAASPWHRSRGRQHGEGLRGSTALGDERDRRDARGRRAALAALQHLGDVFGWSREQRLDRPVAAVAYPTCEPELVGDALGPVAVADALHAAFDAHPHGAPVASLLTHVAL